MEYSHSVLVIIMYVKRGICDRWVASLLVLCARVHRSLAFYRVALRAATPNSLRLHLVPVSFITLVFACTLQR